MFEKVSAFRVSTAMALHAGQTQAVVAQNVANADTPGYVARDLPAFSSVYSMGESRARHMESNLRASRSGHLHGVMDTAPLGSPFEVKSISSPNGNQVSLETEMLKSVGAKRQHDRALAIYKSALNVMRSALRST